MNISFLSNGASVTGLGRHELLALIEAAKRELLAAYENLTAVQTRCTELLEETRAQRRELDEADLQMERANARIDGLIDRERHHVRALMGDGLYQRLREARAKHPDGPTLLALVEEVGEVASAIRREPHRVRDELLDVAVVALRLYLGEGRLEEPEAPLLPGWTCQTCLVFNGEAKERTTVCRCCGAVKP